MNFFHSLPRSYGIIFPLMKKKKKKIPDIIVPIIVHTKNGGSIAVIA